MQTKQPLGNVPAATARITAVLLLMAAAAFGDVKATVDNPAVYRGDPVTLTLNATGGDITFPPLTEIAGYPVEDSSTSRNIMIANGQTTRSIQQRFVFTPTADVTVPSIDVTVDGKTEHTLPIRVKVLDPKAAPEGAPVQMALHLSKKEAYVGEPVELDLVFKYKPGTRIDDIRISEPKLEHFWSKRINTDPERSSDKEGYITQTYRYLLFAQQPGDLEIPAIFAQVGTKVSAPARSPFNDPFFGGSVFGTQLQYKKVYSDPAPLHVLPLPDGLDVYGTFTMNADVDKTTVEANRPVNLHIHIEGSGNVEDIKKFEPRFEHAVVYANDPVVKGGIKDGTYYGTFDQTVAIIPDRDLTIPPQAFRFFDSRTKQVKTLQTPSFAIKVTGASAAAQSAPAVESAVPAQEPATAAPAEDGNGGFALYPALAIFAAGFALGAASLWLLPGRRGPRERKQAKTPPMAARIKAAKQERDLFELLLPFKGQSAPIDEALEKLEANLFRGAAHKIDRKALLDHFGKPHDETIRFI